MRFLASAILFLGLGLAWPASGEEPPPHVPLPEIERSGTGPVTVLLIPCMSCRWRSWDTFLERNQSAYTMYAITVPGFGGTPLPDLPRDTEGTPWRDNLLNGLSRLIVDENLRDIVLIGHSWGTMVSVQLAARLPARISSLISVDGSITSPWVPDTRDERLAEARRTEEEWGTKLADAEEWRLFNGGGDTLAPPEAPTMERQRSVLYHGMFMATDRTALLQYWRENLLIDLSAELRALKLPILDLRAIRGGDMEHQRKQHLEVMAAERSPSNVKTVFLYDTSHFVMEHRPELFDRIVADFVAGREIQDFRPSDTPPN